MGPKFYEARSWYSAYPSFQIGAMVPVARMNMKTVTACELKS